jgi:hypothetical protein
MRWDGSCWVCKIGELLPHPAWLTVENLSGPPNPQPFNGYLHVLMLVHTIALFRVQLPAGHNVAAHAET